MSTSTTTQSSAGSKGLLALGTLPVACTVIVAINGLYIFLVALGNITDFDTNQAFVQHVLAMDTINFGAGEGVNIDQDVAWRAIESPLVQNIAYIGVIICVCSAWIFYGTVRRRDAGGEPFVLRGQFRQILTLLVPAIVYVIAIHFAGIYLSSLVFMAYFMGRHGGHRWWVTLLVSVGLPLVLFAMFEVWFKTPLPKGPIEALLGLA